MLLLLMYELKSVQRPVSVLLNINMKFSGCEKSPFPGGCKIAWLRIFAPGQNSERRSLFGICPDVNGFLLDFRLVSLWAIPEDFL